MPSLTKIVLVATPEPVRLTCSCGQVTAIHPDRHPFRGWYYVAGSDGGYTCPACERRRADEAAAQRRRTAERAERDRVSSIRANIEPHLLAAGVPREFRAKGLRDMDRSQFRDFAAVEQVCRDLERGALITVTIAGPTGRGKTHLACGFVRALYESGAADPGRRPALFVSVYAIARRLEQARDKYRERDRIAHGVAMRPWLLVVDDYGDTDNKLVRRIQYEACMGRFEAGLRTILTTNLDVQRDFVGTEARLASRLWERGEVLDRSDFGDYRRVVRPPLATAPAETQGELFRV